MYSQHTLQQTLGLFDAKCEADMDGSRAAQLKQ